MMESQDNELRLRTEAVDGTAEAVLRGGPSCVRGGNEQEEMEQLPAEEVVDNVIPPGTFGDGEIQEEQTESKSEGVGVFVGGLVVGSGACDRTDDSDSGGVDASLTGCGVVFMCFCV